MEKSKLSNQQYRFVCELLWGGPPVDRDWAESTPLFQRESVRLLELYPELNKSFFKYKTDKLDSDLKKP